MSSDRSTALVRQLLGSPSTLPPLSQALALLSGLQTRSQLSAAELLQGIQALYPLEPLTPLQAVRLLAALGYPAHEAAKALKLVFLQLTAFEVGELLLDAQAYPGLSSKDMSGALIEGGFTAEDAGHAAAALYPVTTTVQAREKWQASGYYVYKGHQGAIRYKGGQWTANPATGLYGPEGWRTPAKPGYTLPGAMEGGLVGRVGDKTFFVGSARDTPIGTEGSLEFCINDDLDARYGVGFVDNIGALLLEVKRKV